MVEAIGWRRVGFVFLRGDFCYSRSDKCAYNNLVNS